MGRRARAGVVAGAVVLLAAIFCAALRPSAASAAGGAARILIDYPSQDSIFPPEFPPPQFEWRDEAAQASQWKINISFADGTAPLHLSSAGEKMQIGEIDPECVADTNKPPELTPEQATGHTWRPEAAAWETIRRHSVRAAARLRFRGIDADGRPVSAGEIQIHTSADPVGAPVFYRDVPLMPVETEKGVINPLPLYAVPLIQWKLRDLGQTSSRTLLSNMPTCANCHSFSADGKTIGLDVDGPHNDKGLYALATIQPDTVIDRQNIIEWSSFRGKMGGRFRVAFMPQVSPDGQYVVATINDPGLETEAHNTDLQGKYYVVNFKDYRFLQVFYPTRGVLAWYHRATGRLTPLPGADDPRYVQSNASWSPDGKYLVFGKAEAREPFPAGQPMALQANDPNETQIRYDLWRIPFNEGRGGKAEPVAGASNNGKSNSFPKVSPDGKWIVYVQAKNGLLMRPDSELYIIPAQGGTARRLRSNAAPMNSWHSWSPNSRWLVFSSKRRGPYTRMYLTHIDAQGNDSPAILVENATAANRAVNIPEFVNVAPEQFAKLDIRVAQYYGLTDRATWLTGKGRIQEAIEVWRQALEMEPTDDRTNYSLAALLMQSGHFAEAQPLLEQTLRTNPDYPLANTDLGVVLAATGRMDEAIPHFERELVILPKSAYAHSNYARALAQSGRLGEAVKQFRLAAEAGPNDAAVHTNLGRALAMQHDPTSAIAEFQKAIEINPDFPTAHHYLGDAYYFAQGQTGPAMIQWREVLRLDPDNLVVLAQCAWALATDPDATLRNGAQAVEFAEHASRLRGGRQPFVLDALAAAYAEAGRFGDAVQTAREALDLSLRQDNSAMAEALRAKIAQYEAGQPHRAAPQAAR